MERYLVKTDHGDVVVHVDRDADAFDSDLLSFSEPEGASVEGIEMEVPLRAFAAKMLEIVERQAGETPGGDRMRRMMIQEKATSDLRRIERWAQRQRGKNGGG